MFTKKKKRNYLGIFFLSGTFLSRIWKNEQFFHEFWIIVEQSIFIVEKRLPYDSRQLGGETGKMAKKPTLSIMDF